MRCRVGGGSNLERKSPVERRNSFSYTNKQFSEISTLFQNAGIVRSCKFGGGGGLSTEGRQD